MNTRRKMEKPSLLMIIVLSTLGIALLFTFIGIGTTYWYEVKGIHGSSWHSGLWKSCIKNEFVGDQCRHWDNVYADVELSMPSWFKAVQAMTILGMLALLGALSVGISTILMPANYRKLLQVFTVIGSYAAGALLLIGIIIFAAKIEEGESELIVGSGSYEYSFILVVVALVLCITAGIVGIVAILRGQQTQS